MHTMCRFLYSKGKIHTSYFKSDGIWGSGFREVYPPPSCRRVILNRKLSMQSIPHKKLGYTLVELLAVISIMGILSGMGVVGFQTMVSHTRTKDAALNVAAYLERTANKARQLNATLCVRPDGVHKLVTYKAACDAGDGNFGDPIDQLVLENQVTILEDDVNDVGGGGINLIASGEKKASFVPRPGLSSAPYEGYIVVKYGGERGAAVKEKTKNTFTPKWNPSGSWSEL